MGLFDWFWDYLWPTTNPPQSQAESLVAKYCHCESYGLAKYRGQIKVQKNDAEVMNYLSGKGDLRMSSFFLDPSVMKLIVIDAKKYWKKTFQNENDNGNSYIIQFIACNACVNDEMKKRMIYHPGGWHEAEIGKTDYEPLDLS